MLLKIPENFLLLTFDKESNLILETRKCIEIPWTFPATNLIVFPVFISRKLRISFRFSSAAARRPPPLPWPPGPPVQAGEAGVVRLPDQGARTGEGDYCLVWFGFNTGPCWKELLTVQLFTESLHIKLSPWLTA